MDNETKVEKKRLSMMMRYERQAFRDGYQRIAGLDEVGRGPLAGPVVAAAVILPRRFFIPGINDSKKLTGKQRIHLAAEIRKVAIAWSVASVFPPYLDRINILNATREAMRLCVCHLYPQPDFLLIDALELYDINIRQRALIKGDSLSASIASASILAKVDRDSAMEAFEEIYPGYGFAKHKGYATREHIERIMQSGPCAIHRSSFEPVKSWLAGGGDYEQPGLFEQSDA